MPMIMVPTSFQKFFLEYDTWNHQWQCFVLVGNIAWYKGIGANPDLASKDVIHNINNGLTIEQTSKTTRDQTRIKELEKQSKSSGHRALERARENKTTYEDKKPELKDLF